MNITKKFLLIFLITVIIVLIFIPSAFALKTSDFEPTIVKSEVLISKAERIIGVIQVIGTIVSIATLIILGIKYMMGSIEEKAQYKKSMLPYLIGSIMLFAASNITGMIYNFTKDIGSTTPPSVVLTWENTKNAVEYLDGGGNLADVPDETLKSWYGQLSRLAGNRGINQEEYEAVKSEMKRRGLY